MMSEWQQTPLVPGNILARVSQCSFSPLVLTIQLLVYGFYQQQGMLDGPSFWELESTLRNVYAHLLA